MIAAQVQTPTLVQERALDRLVDRLPEGATERLRANLAAFRAWIAAPAYRARGPKGAILHILHAVGPAVQLKVEFATILAEIPGGYALLAEALADEPADLLPAEQDPLLAKAAAHLQAATRIWLRFVTFHPDLAGVEAKVGVDRLTDVTNLGFHADNLLAVGLMGADGSCGKVRTPILHAIAGAAADHAARYHAAVEELVEAAAPRLDEGHPFGATTLQDLLALPPYGGPARSTREMDASIGALFSS